MALRLALAFAPVVGAINHANQQKRAQAFLASHMRPEMVAMTLRDVEGEWQSQVNLYDECLNMAGEDTMVDCSGASNAFKASCSKIVHAVVQGSAGDRSVVQEYMSDVCEQKVLEGWRKDQCKSLADGIVGMMTEDTWRNREESISALSLCQRMWQQLQNERKTQEASVVTEKPAPKVEPPVESPGPSAEPPAQNASAAVEQAAAAAAPVESAAQHDADPAVAAATEVSKPDAVKPVEEPEVQHESEATSPPAYKRFFKETTDFFKSAMHRVSERVLGVKKAPAPAEPVPAAEEDNSTAPAESMPAAEEGNSTA